MAGNSIAARIGLAAATSLELQSQGTSSQSTPGSQAPANKRQRTSTPMMDSVTITKQIMLNPNHLGIKTPCPRWRITLNDANFMDTFSGCGSTLSNVVEFSRNRWPIIAEVQVRVFLTDRLEQSATHLKMREVHPEEWSTFLVRSNPSSAIVIQPKEPIIHPIGRYPRSSLCVVCAEGGILRVLESPEDFKTENVVVPPTNSNASAIQPLNLLISNKHLWLQPLRFSVNQPELLTLLSQSNGELFQFAWVMNASEDLFEKDAELNVDRSCDTIEFLNQFAADESSNAIVKPDAKLAVNFSGERAINMLGEKLSGFLFKAQAAVLYSTATSPGYKFLEGLDGRYFVQHVPNRASAEKFKQVVMLWARTFLSNGSGIAGLHEAHKKYILGQDFVEELKDVDENDIAEPEVNDLFVKVANIESPMTLMEYRNAFMLCFGEESSCNDIAEAAAELRLAYFIHRVEPELRFVRSTFACYHIPKIVNQLHGSINRLMPKFGLVTFNDVGKTLLYADHRSYRLDQGRESPHTCRSLMTRILDSSPPDHACAFLYAIAGITSFDPEHRVSVYFSSDDTLLKGSPVNIKMCSKTLYIDYRRSFTMIRDHFKDLVENPKGHE